MKLLADEEMNCITGGVAFIPEHPHTRLPLPGFPYPGFPYPGLPRLPNPRFPILDPIYEKPVID